MLTDEKNNFNFYSRVIDVSVVNSQNTVNGYY